MLQGTLKGVGSQIRLSELGLGEWVLIPKTRIFGFLAAKNTVHT